MAHIGVLTKDDGFPSDFTHKRVSDALDRKGEVLAYKHLLLGWMGPKSAYMVKLVAENAHKMIDKGYEVNNMIIDLVTPSGGAIVGAITGIADIVLFKYMQDYAGEQARANETSKEMEMAKLLFIMCLPFGMVYIIGLIGYQISKEDWGAIANVLIPTAAGAQLGLPGLLLGIDWGSIFGGPSMEVERPGFRKP